MGVIPCYREGCENILCDDRIDGKDICRECQQDFINTIGNAFLNPDIMLQVFRAFMGTSVLSTVRERGQISAEEFLKE